MTCTYRFRSELELFLATIEHSGNKQCLVGSLTLELTEISSFFIFSNCGALTLIDTELPLAVPLVSTEKETDLPLPYLAFTSVKRAFFSAKDRYIIGEDRNHKSIDWIGLLV